MEDSFKEFDCGDGTNGRWTMNEIPDGPHQFFVYGVDEMDNKGELAKLDFHVGEFICDLCLGVAFCFAPEYTLKR